MCVYTYLFPWIYLYISFIGSIGLIGSSDSIDLINLIGSIGLIGLIVLIGSHLFRDCCLILCFFLESLARPGGGRISCVHFAPMSCVLD